MVRFCGSCGLIRDECTGSLSERPNECSESTFVCMSKKWKDGTEEDRIKTIERYILDEMGVGR